MPKKKPRTKAPAADGDEEGRGVRHEGRHIVVKESSTRSQKDAKLSLQNESNNPPHRPGGRAEIPPESAAHYTGRGAETTPGHDTPFAARAARIRTEQQRLRQWAEEHGKLGTKLPPEDGRGGEHIVQFDEKSQRIFKATRPDAQQGYGIAFGSFSQGATPSEYLDRLANQNRIFGDDIRVERIVPAGGKLSIVTSQPWIKGRDATAQEIDSYMEAKGFRKIGEGAYHNGRENLLVHDLHPKNAKVGENGHFHAIDPVIQRVTPDFAKDLENHPVVVLAATTPRNTSALASDSSQAKLAFVAIGSNLGHPRQNVLRAFDLLQTLSEQPLLRSALRETAPVDCPPGSPAFINAAAGLAPRPGETPRSFLAKLQFLEKQIGHAPKKFVNQPRLIDLDLIAFGRQNIHEPELVLPHPRAHLRRFVLQPLHDIAPDFVLPGQAKTVAELLTELSLP